MVPHDHQRFLDRALRVLRSDDRLLGVATAGSWITGTMDRYSDLDLVAVVSPDSYAEVLAGRRALVERLGTLLASFTGEHVGEPRLLICLYDDPLLHVDVKFTSLADFGVRIENPVVLWERDGALTQAMTRSEPNHPMPDLQWIEDRFWIWVHYAALRLGRGELLEVIDFLSFLRGQVLGPLALVSRGQLPRGVRRIETLASDDLPEFVRTVPAYDRAACGEAIESAVRLYLRLREQAANDRLRRNAPAERAARDYLTRVIARAD